MEVRLWGIMDSVADVGAIASALVHGVYTRMVVAEVVSTSKMPETTRSSARLHTTNSGKLFTLLLLHLRSSHSNHGFHHLPAIQTSAWGCPRPRPRSPPPTTGVTGALPGCRLGPVVQVVGPIGSLRPQEGVRTAEALEAAVEVTILEGNVATCKNDFNDCLVYNLAITSPPLLGMPVTPPGNGTRRLFQPNSCTEGQRADEDLSRGCYIWTDFVGLAIGLDIIINTCH